MSPTFLRELKLIDSSLFVVWDGLAERYLIASHGPASVFRDTYILEDVVCDENMGFCPLDNRILTRIRLAKLGFNGVDAFLKEKERKKKEKRVKAFRLYLEMKREFYKKFHKLWKTRTLDLGGK